MIIYKPHEFKIQTILGICPELTFIVSCPQWSYTYEVPMEFRPRLYPTHHENVTIAREYVLEYAYTLYLDFIEDRSKQINLYKQG